MHNWSKRTACTYTVPYNNNNNWVQPWNWGACRKQNQKQKSPTHPQICKQENKEKTSLTLNPGGGERKKSPVEIEKNKLNSLLSHSAALGLRTELQHLPMQQVLFCFIFYTTPWWRKVVEYSIARVGCGPILMDLLIVSDQHSACKEGTVLVLRSLTRGCFARRLFVFE